MKIAEWKIITAGGFYDRVEDCAAMIRRHAATAHQETFPIDLSISYDYGAEINAFARCYRALSSLNPPLADAELREETKRLFDRFYDVYTNYLLAAQQEDKGAVFSRSLAFLADGLITMFRATEEPRYREALKQVCDIILQFERRYPAIDGTPEAGFLMGQKNSAEPYIDCHAAILLALVRATPILEDPRFLESIDLGVAAYRLDTVAAIFYGPRKQDVVAVDFVGADKKRSSLHGYWNFGAGLSLRLFKALRTSGHPEIHAIYERHAARLELFETVMRIQISRSLRVCDDALEIRCSVLSEETNSETQPWVALGLIDDSGDD